MFSNLYKKSNNREPYPISHVMVLLQPVESSKDGNIVHESEYLPFDVAESLLPFTSSDFSISSIVAAGALPKLKTTFMSFSSTLSLADSFDNLKFVENETK